MKKYIVTKANGKITEGKSFQFYFTALKFAKAQSYDCEISKLVANGLYKHIKFV